MLAWKTAELSVLGRAHGDLPILLLDDVSSELDPSAQRVSACGTACSTEQHTQRERHR
jgi:recombinational DNA repair ATPase RecF